MAEPSPPLRILQLTSENIKKLRAVEITPAGDVVEITGANGAGKSSVLDSILFALGGGETIQKQPVRKGQTKAVIKLDLGELKVERRFTPNGSTLQVSSPDGAPFKSPQALLDAITGELAFDPLAFTRMDPKAQVDELKRVAQIDVDIDTLERQAAGDFNKRTDVNRDARSRRAAADAIVVADGLPDAPLDELALVDEIQKAGEKNAGIEREKGERDKIDRDSRDHLALGERLRAEAEELRKRAADRDRAAGAAFKEATALQERMKKFRPLEKPVDVAAIRVRLEHARQVNAKCAQRERRRSLEAEAEQLEAEARLLTDAIDARRKAMADAVARAKMPVEGLGLEDGVVTYNGLPFDQASASEQLTVSFAIARAANPRLKVILIKDASLLDQKSLARLAELAHGYQCWIERVDTSGTTGIYIEDGAVRAVNGKPVKAEDSA